MIDFEFNINRRDISFDIEGSDVIVLKDTSDIPKYNGSYEVTPKMTEQTLQTKQKYMLNDVTVKGVPVYKTKNDQGGYTVFIATEGE